MKLCTHFVLRIAYFKSETKNNQIKNCGNSCFHSINFYILGR